MRDRSRDSCEKNCCQFTFHVHVYVEIDARIARRRADDSFICIIFSTSAVRQRLMIHLYYSLHKDRATEADDPLVLFSPERCATPSGDHGPLSVY